MGSDKSRQSYNRNYLKGRVKETVDITQSGEDLKS